MPGYTTALGAIVLWMATFAMAADTTQATRTSEQAKTGPAESITNGLPIDSGFVLVKGEYLPSPYVVGTRGEELFLNGRPIDTERLHVRRWGRGFHPGWRRPGGDRPEGAPVEPETEWPRRPYSFFNHAAYLEHRLQGNGLLIVFDDEMATFAPDGCEISVLEILLSDKPREAKVQALMQVRAGRIESARWAELVDAFQPSEELAARAKELKKERTVYRPQVTPAPSLSRFIKYGVTIMGIVLGVVALGTLLNHRPKSQAAWREIDASGDSILMVVRNVVLVVILGFFDLGCTLLAQGSIGFVEINPLGSGLLDNPALLAAFKIASLSVGCVILLALRRYRGAQVASWWLCLVCTILTFRWATYGTLFLA